MSTTRQVSFASISILLLLSSNASGAFKFKQVAVAELTNVAVVDNSFLQHAAFEKAKITSFKQEKRVMASDDPEYLVMESAGNQTLAEITKGMDVAVMPRSEVIANAEYQELTSDPEDLKRGNWYRPEGYRVIELKKANAIRLCKALGVDAVVDVHFKYSTTGSSSSIGGIGWGKSNLALVGEVTIIDKNGVTLVSGKIKSDKIKEGSGLTLGDSESSGGSSEIKTGETAYSDLYPNLLASFLANLTEELGD